MTSAKLTLAQAALDHHERTYGATVPDRLRAFWQGEAFTYDRKCLPRMKLPLLEEGTLRLALTVPSWSVQAELGGLDDAISGPDGEWRHAGTFVPLFLVEQSQYVVARLDEPQCPIGWYVDGMHDRDDDGHRDGVYQLAPSLDAFLAGLVDLDTADFETDSEESAWVEEAAELVGADDADD